MFKNEEIDSYRKLFPHLEQPHYYLNHAAFGVLSTKVNQHINNHLNERSYGVIESYLIDFNITSNILMRTGECIIHFVFLFHIVFCLFVKQNYASFQ